MRAMKALTVTTNDSAAKSPRGTKVSQYGKMISSPDSSAANTISRTDQALRIIHRQLPGPFRSHTNEHSQLNQYQGGGPNATPKSKGRRPLA